MTHLRRYIVAAAQYRVEQQPDFAAWEAKLTDWVGRAAAAGAKLAVFPEYAGMELTSLDPVTVGDLHASIAALGQWIERYDSVHRALAARFDMHILAGSVPIRRDDGRFVNRAVLHAPNGRSGAQEKLIMTRFEREEWDICGGSDPVVFETTLGVIAVSICYDSEFPLIARAQVEAGAELILIPSATDTMRGYHRVRIGAQARALENQCYTMQAPTVGEAEWTPSLDISRGAAGVFGPPDNGFSDDGVVAMGALDRPEWLFAEIDLDLVATVRRNGAVLNHLHWNEQTKTAGFGKSVARRISLV